MTAPQRFVYGVDMTADPTLITEPVVHDYLARDLRGRDRLWSDEYQRATPSERLDMPGGPIVPTGIIGSAVDFIEFWQAIGPHINKAELDRIARRVQVEQVLAAVAPSWVSNGPSGMDRSFIICAKTAPRGVPIFTLYPGEDVPWATQAGWYGGDTRIHQSITDAIRDRVDHPYKGDPA